MSADRRRWLILALLFAASFLNYFDRQTLSILKPAIKAEFGFNDSGYSMLVTAFMVPYIVMYTLGGRLSDLWGSRFAMGVFVGVWSVVTLATGWVKSFGQLAACRFGLGAAEPGNYPAGIRAITILFPATQRGFALSVFSAGSAIGAVLAPPCVAFMALHYGWRSAFWIPGLLGLGWVIVWLGLTRGGAVAAISGGSPAVSWRDLVRSRELWGIVTARLISDPVWYFYLFWIPGYLQERLGLTLAQAGAVGWIPFLVADLTGIGTTSLSDLFVRRGMHPVRSRTRILILAAAFAPIGLLAPYLDSVPIFLLVASISSAVCVTWLFSSAALMAETFPRSALGTMMGITGSFGAAGALLFNSQIGGIVDRFGYVPVFVIAAMLHPLAALVIYLTVKPRSAESAS